MIQDAIDFSKRVVLARLLIHALLVLSFVVSGFLISIGDGGSLTLKIDWTMGGEDVRAESENRNR